MSKQIERTPEGADTKMRTPQKPAKKPCQAKCKQRVAERMLEELVETFEDLPAFSFALTSDRTYGIGPTLISGIELVSCACGTLGLDYEGPFPESQFAVAKVEAARRHVEIMAIVKEKVRQLRRAGVPFVLAWEAFGERGPHFDHSTDYSFDEARKLLVDYLRHEIGWRID